MMPLVSRFSAVGGVALIRAGDFRIIDKHTLFDVSRHYSPGADGTVELSQ